MCQPVRSPFEGFPQLDAQLDLEQDSAAKLAKHRPSLLNRVRAKVAPVGRLFGSASAFSSSDVSVSSDQPNWDLLPQHLLEEIFARVGRQAYSDEAARKVRAIHGVSASNRRIVHALMRICRHCISV